MSGKSEGILRVKKMGGHVGTLYMENILHPLWCTLLKVTLPLKQLRFYFAASENHSFTHYKTGWIYPVVMLLNWLNFGGILFEFFLLIFLPKFWLLFGGQTFCRSYLWNGWADWHETKGGGCWANFVTLTYDIDLGFSSSNIQITISQKWEGQLIWN